MMKNLFERATVDEVKSRSSRLRPDSSAQWGKMNAAQALAHLATSLESATGVTHPPRETAGYLFGWAIKPLVLGNDKPMKRNAPTAKSFVISDQRDFEGERTRLNALIDRFASGGPAVCTTHPHPFFGRLAPQEWATLMYKHLDHHLRQFGV